MRIDVTQRGAVGDSKHDDTAAFLEALAELAEVRTATDDGTYQGGGVLVVPSGMYRLTAPISLTPKASNGQTAFQTSMLGDGRIVSRLKFECDDGVIGCEYAGNFASNGRVADVGIWGAKRALRFKGSGNGSVERVHLSGPDTGLVLDGANTTLVRDVTFQTARVGAQLTGDCNRATLDGCQFNGPAINVLHEGGVGHTVRDCNSEGGALSVCRGGGNIVHEGWTSEGALAGQPARFVFEVIDGHRLCAVGFAIRDSFIGGPAIVSLGPGACVYDFEWSGQNMTPNAAGAIVDNSAPGCGVLRYVLTSGFVSVPMFARDPDEWHDLREQGLAAYAPNQAGNAPVLPTKAREGVTAFAWHGRKAGEAAGAGTGVPVYFSRGAWRVIGTDAEVAT